MSETLRQNGEAELDNDTAYSVLANRRRRYAVHYLKQHDGPVAVDELTEQIAAWENDKEPAQLESQERKRVYISLHQSHLDSMDEAGIVEYDPDNRTVELSERFRTRDIYLEVVDENNVPWSYYYAGLAVVGAAFLTLVAADVGVLAQVSGFQAGIVIVVLLFVSALFDSIAGHREKLGDDGPPPDVRRRS